MQKNHKHLIINATVRNPIKCEDACKSWLTSLVRVIDMQVLILPVAKYCDTKGNEGVTGAIVIETSHASIHVWSSVEEPYVRMDVYSCKDFDPKNVIKHLSDAMDIIDFDYVIIDRNKTKLQVLTCQK